MQQIAQILQHTFFFPPKGDFEGERHLSSLHLPT